MDEKGIKINAGGKTFSIQASEIKLN